MYLPCHFTVFISHASAFKSDDTRKSNKTLLANFTSYGGGGSGGGGGGGTYVFLLNSANEGKLLLFTTISSIELFKKIFG